MNIIASNSDLTEQMIRLISSYSNYSWSVAWASSDFKVFKSLQAKKNRIRKIVVGTHFYQTHPNFLRYFIDSKAVRFIRQPDGVFHPKVYMFSNTENEWECIIGSPNFTTSAFNKNNEISVLLSSKDNDVNDVYNKIITSIDDSWNRAHKINRKEYEEYKALWEIQNQRIGRLSGRYNSYSNKAPLDIDIFKLNWDEFYYKIKTDKLNSLNDRLRVLKESNKIFNKTNHFEDLSLVDRRCIAGIASEQIIKWGYFGRMQGSIWFKKRITDNDKNYSLALDAIPLKGNIDYNNYSQFIDHFKNSYIKGYKGIASPTRLLSMKRPDYFLSVNGKNKKQICKSLGIPLNITFENYWSEIICRILDTPLWNSKKPKGKSESEVWEARTAFLDVLYYQPYLD